jgi:branched-chain amino acid transport system permease protein
MENVVTSVVGGIVAGSTYTLIAMGLVLAFRSTGTFNFAYGEFMLFPAYIVARWQSENKGFGLSLLVGLIVVTVISVLFYLLVLQRIVGLPLFMGVIATLGLALVLDGVMVILFGTQQYDIQFPGLPAGNTDIFGVRISSASVVITIFSLVLAVVIAGLLRFTQLGTQIRAGGQDPLLASQGGIHIRAIYMISWGLAGILAGAAGVTYGSIDLVSTSMVSVALAVFPAMLLGGLDSIEGAIVGGLAVGILQGFTATYIGGQYLDVVTYSMLLVVLLVRPTGLFGTKQITRA